MFVKKENSLRKFKLVGFIVGGIIVIFSIVSMIIVMVTYNSQFPKVERHDDTITLGLRYDDFKEEYPRELVNFNSGANQLQGYIYGLENDLGLVVVAHGLGGGADSYLSQIIYLVDQGWQVFAYDATGSYDSEGKSTKGFPQSLIDLDAALSYITSQKQFDNLPLLLFGHSWGGYAVANALHFDYEIHGVVSISGSNSASEMIIEQGEKMMGTFMVTQKPYLWIYQRILFGKTASLKATDAISKTETPVLIVHGIDDESIAYNGSSIISNFLNTALPHVSTLTVNAPNRSGHNSLFRSQDAIDYIEKLNIDYRALYNQYNENIPYKIQQEFYAPLDRSLAQDLNGDLMDRINDFFLMSLSK